MKTKLLSAAALVAVVALAAVAYLAPQRAAVSPVMDESVSKPGAAKVPPVAGTPPAAPTNGADANANAHDDAAIAALRAQGKIGAGSSAVAGNPSIEEARKADPNAYRSAPPLTAKELESAKALLATFAMPERGKTAMNSFLQRLADAGLGPIAARDENPYTGRMVVVRTKEALEGTRYLHAQYFEDSNAGKDPFLQHLSFEIRPTPDCMVQARQLVEKLYGKRLGAPIKPRGDEWIEWKVDGYSVWIMRLGPEDIAYDPFNARTIADIGTCRVAKEVPPDEDHGSHRD